MCIEKIFTQIWHQGIQGEKKVIGNLVAFKALAVKQPFIQKYYKKKNI